MAYRSVLDEVCLFMVNAQVVHTHTYTSGGVTVTFYKHAPSPLDAYSTRAYNRATATAIKSTTQKCGFNP